MIHIFNRQVLNQTPQFYLCLLKDCAKDFLYHSKSRVQDILFLKICQIFILFQIFWWLKRKIQNSLCRKIFASDRSTKWIRSFENGFYPASNASKTDPNRDTEADGSNNKKTIMTAHVQKNPKTQTVINKTTDDKGSLTNMEDKP